MTVFRFEPAREWSTLSDRMRKFFEDISEGITFETGTYNPRVDVSEDNEYVYVTADLPGMKREDIKLSIQDEVLTIKGEKKRAESDEKRTYYRAERCYGSFSRSFTLPVEVDGEKVKAKFEDGVLNIELPKVTKKVSERPIEIK